MIDAQRAAVPAILADRFREQPIAVLIVAVGVGRRKRPVLAFGREAVGRSADAAAGDKEFAMRPQIGTESVGSQSQVVIQTDAQAALEGVLLGGGELQIELPLDVFVKQNAAPVFSGEFLRTAGDSGSWYCSGQARQFQTSGQSP